MTYHIFCEWFLEHYGRPFAASEAEYNAAMLRPCYDTSEAARLQRDYEFDYAKELQGDAQ